jgi:hypothetical protein
MRAEDAMLLGSACRCAEFARASALALLLALAGCGGDDDDGEEAAVAACAAAGSAAACQAITGPDFRCAWVGSVVVTGDCQTVDELRCVPYGTHAAPPACLPIPGCHGSQPGQPGKLISPGFREEAPGVTRLVNECFSDAIGYQECESGDAAAAADPACACVCDPAP